MIFGAVTGGNSIGTVLQGLHTADVVPLFTSDLRTQLEAGVLGSLDILPALLVALVVLLVGLYVAKKTEPVVARVARRADADGLVRRTPLAPVFGDRDGAVARALGAIAKYYVFLVAVFAALEHIGFTHVTQWLASGIDYLPVFVGGLALFVVGFVVADHAAGVARDSETAARLGDPDLVADGVKVTLYAIVAVVALDTLGASVGIVHVVAEAFAFGAGLALALAVAYVIVQRNRDRIEPAAKDLVGDD